MLALICLAACTAPKAKTEVTTVTTWRVMPETCAPLREELRLMTEDRNRWKKYAKLRETLSP